MFVISKSAYQFQHSIMFVSKAGAYLSRGLDINYTQVKAPGLTHKQQTRLEMLASDKHSSFLRAFVNYRHSKLYNIGPRRRPIEWST